ncbi:MAG: rhodanese-related sulfurtransferase [Acidimicrobiia bacterium]
MYTIAAFYRFTHIDDPSAVQGAIIGSAQRASVNGTVLIATEGINGTIGGSADGVEAVLETVRSESGAVDLEVKYASAETDPFLRLKVRVKKEIVSLGVGEIDTEANTGVHVPADEWNDLISDPDVVVIDTRNAYEIAIGSFEGATDPGTRSFTQFPAWIENNPDLKDKRVAMFCTGGIRCEKASAYLKEAGFSEVFQLEGGILKYLETVDEGDSLWNGECFVFDRRVSVGHGLVPGSNEICPNCNTVLDDLARSKPSYVMGVTCPSCHDTITPDRFNRFSERQTQIELAAARGTTHLGS